MYFKKFSAFFFFIFFLFLSQFKVFCFNGKTNPEQAHPQNWMNYLPDSALITNINIPGTHDSGTAKVTMCTDGYAKCQSKSITEQLNSGVRYLDLRVNENGLINHGGIACRKSFFSKLYIGDIENYVSNFLRSNPSETVILQVKSEGGGNCANIINSNLTNSDLYHRNNKNIEELTLGEVRGKFMIFSRQQGVNDAYNYYSWDDNTSFDEIWLDSKKGYLQDKYESSIANKKEIIDDFYGRIWQNNNAIKELVVNFTSFSQAPITLNFLYPDVNNYMSEFVSANSNKKLGIVLMDNPDNRLIEKIYKTNYNRDF